MIGVFDSGFGGLVVLREFLRVLPDYDYLYLGDNARIPYGTRSDRVVIRFTEQAVDYLFRQGCSLIVLACHTASARALRRIQQVFLPEHYPEGRVLGVLIPTVEEAVARSRGKNIGVIGTEGTVTSRSFELELKKLDPNVTVLQQACPLLVPIIESGEQDWEGTGLILRRYLAPFPGRVDTLILGCTHYSILKEQIGAIMGNGHDLICSGQVTAAKLVDYLKRHPELESRLSRGRTRRYHTTDLTPRFAQLASLFMGRSLSSEVVEL
ncbi:MAG TPA: glutamate racemase [Desulfobaccales bacterium]|jgi:glutamate racemase|nr:glutamate racemase [Desulfobaccales bacterium]